jgi:hypothetical protein
MSLLWRTMTPRGAIVIGRRGGRPLVFAFQTRDDRIARFPRRRICGPFSQIQPDSLVFLAFLSQGVTLARELP